MADVGEIGQAGERIVAQWLRGSGYTIDRVDTRSPGSTDIEARSSQKCLLVQVKSAVLPNEPSSLSSDEKRNIKSRATRIGCEAWEAGVQLDPNLRPAREITWRQLNQKEGI
jgi:Holliday junction resolvase